MDGYLVNGSIGMPRGSLLRIDDGAGALVYVWEGELYLTQEGSRQDHLLRARQWFRVDRGGAAIAQAFRRSVVSLSSPTPEVRARQIVLKRSGAAAPVVLHRQGARPLWQTLRKLLVGLVAPRAGVQVN